MPLLQVLRIPVLGCCCVAQSTAFYSGRSFWWPSRICDGVICAIDDFSPEQRGSFPGDRRQSTQNIIYVTQGDNTLTYIDGWTNTIHKIFVTYYVPPNQGYVFQQLIKDRTPCSPLPCSTTPMDLGLSMLPIFVSELQHLLRDILSFHIVIAAVGRSGSQHRSSHVYC